MAYTPEWETLPETQRRIEAYGLSEKQVQLELCRAISDKNIAVQVRVAKIDPSVGGRTLEWPSVEVPRYLTPADFDWKRSRPRKLWETGPPQGRDYIGHWFWEPRSIDLIRLRSADVVDCLCPRSVAWPEEKTASSTASMAIEGKPRRRGALPKYDWVRARAKFFKLMEDNGGFMIEAEDGWNCQASAEKAITDWFAERDFHPTESTVRHRVAEWLAEWELRNTK